jgi:hypothetical protein
MGRRKPYGSVPTRTQRGYSAKRVNNNRGGGVGGGSERML